MLSCILCHLLVALVLGHEGSLLLLGICGGSDLAGGQGMQPQLGRAAHEHMQLASHPLLCPTVQLHSKCLLVKIRSQNRYVQKQSHAHMLHLPCML